MIKFYKVASPYIDLNKHIRMFCKLHESTVLVITSCVSKFKEHFYSHPEFSLHASSSPYLLEQTCSRQVLNPPYNPRVIRMNSGLFYEFILVGKGEITHLGRIFCLHPFLQLFTTQ